MTRRRQSIVLGVLVGLLAIVAYVNLVPSRSILGDAPVNERVAPLKIENPSLHLEHLERISKQEYTGTHRNIFVATLPAPPPSPAAVAKTHPMIGPMPPPPPPPLQVDLKFFGMVTDSRTGRRRALFNKEDDVYIAAEGETLMNNLRVLHIGNNTVELEEISSGRRTTLTMEQPAAPKS